jgi:hypothetical protein
MCHARQPALGHQVFVCFRPGWDSGAGWDPVGVRGFVTPFDKMRHNFGVRCGAAKRLHDTLAFPHSEGPERATSVYEEASTKKPRCAQGLTLTKKRLPHEWWKIPHRANAKTRDGREHGTLF